MKNKNKKNTNLIIKENLKKGDIIKFDTGPFVDFFAKIEGLDCKNRIWVLLEEPGQYIRGKIQQAEKWNFTKF